MPPYGSYNQIRQDGYKADDIHVLILFYGSHDLLYGAAVKFII